MERFQRICHTCGDLGKEGGCPKCGRTLQTVVVRQLEVSSVSADIIPIPYQGKLWVKPEVTGVTPPKFIEFDESLTKVHNLFLSGQILTFSLYIAAPVKYGKHNFAFSCMQTAAAQGHKVAPLLSTSDWRRLYKISQMNPFYKLYDRYKWDQLVLMSVVFIMVDHSDERFDLVPLMKEILDTRARFNLATVFLSDYKLEELVPRWGSDQYSMIHNVDPERDMARYPVIIQRF